MTENCEVCKQPKPDLRLMCGWGLICIDCLKEGINNWGKTTQDHTIRKWEAKVNIQPKHEEELSLLDNSIEIFVSQPLVI